MLWVSRVLCSAAQAALSDYVCRLGASDLAKQLTWREQDVMLYVLSGTRDEDASAALHIAKGTYRKHMDSIFKKLGVHGREAARRKFLGVE